MEYLIGQKIQDKPTNKSQQSAVYQIHFHYLKKDYGSGYGFLSKVIDVCKLKGLVFTFDNFIDEGYVPGVGSFFSTQCIADSVIWKDNSAIENSVFKVLNDLNMFPTRGWYSKVEVEFVKFLQQDIKTNDECETKETSDAIEIVKEVKNIDNNMNQIGIIQVSNSSSSDETKVPGLNETKSSKMEFTQFFDSNDFKQEQHEPSQFLDIKDCQLKSQQKNQTSLLTITPQSDASMQKQKSQKESVNEQNSESSEIQSNSDEGFSDDNESDSNQSENSQQDEKGESKLEEVGEKHEQQSESYEKKQTDSLQQYQETSTGGGIQKMSNQEECCTKQPPEEAQKENEKQSSQSSSNIDNSESLQVKAVLQESKQVKEKNLLLQKEKSVLEQKVVELIAHNCELSSQIEVNSDKDINSIDQITAQLLQAQQDRFEEQQKEIEQKDAKIKKQDEQIEYLLKEVAWMKEQMQDIVSTKNNTEKILQLILEMKENKESKEV